MVQFFTKVGKELTQPARIFLWAIVSVLAAVTGPFGTYAMLPILTRLALALVIVAAAIICVVMTRNLLRLAFPDLRYGFVSLGVSAVAALLIAPLIWLLLRRAVPPDFASSEPLVRVMALVFVGVLAVDLMRWMLMQTLIRDGTLAPVDGPPRLVARLPDGAGPVILALSASGHHVMIRTTTGVYPIRMRLGDAIAEMEGIDGFCTHRSHWVTATAVAGVDVNGGGRPVLVLSDGTHIPVSKKYQPDVEARGVL